MSNIISKIELNSEKELKKGYFTFEWLLIYIFFFFSFINIITLLLSLFLLFFYFKQREIGALKIMNIITLRTIINPGLSVSIGSVQSIKWIILFTCSLYLIASYFKLHYVHKKKLNKILIPIMIFGIYNIVVSFIFSNLPIVAIFKITSYITIFISVLIGIAITYKTFNWIDWMYKVLFILIITSIPLIFLPEGYLVNGISFQGITNQPNMFGIITTLFIAISLTKLQVSNTKNLFKYFIFIGISYYLIILSKSRTAFITSNILILFYMSFCKINYLKKLLLLTFSCISLILFLYLNDNYLVWLRSFILKGQSDLFISRKQQLSLFINNFLTNPWFGSGFAVPVLPKRSYAFSYEYIVEPGNLFIAVLSYGGIFGLILFCNYMFKILWYNYKNLTVLLLLPVSVILINIGEMVFFSSNNIGIWIYMYLGIYLFYKFDNNEKLHKGD